LELNNLPKTPLPPLQVMIFLICQSLAQAQGHACTVNHWHRHRHQGLQERRTLLAASARCTKLAFACMGFLFHCLLLYSPLQFAAHVLLLSSLPLLLLLQSLTSLLDSPSIQHTAFLI